MVLEKAIERIQGKEEGFTLVELLIVVAIIAILAAIAIPQFSAYRKRGYVATLNSDAANVYTAATAYFTDNPTATSTCDAGTISGSSPTATVTSSNGTPGASSASLPGYQPSAIVACSGTMTASSGAFTLAVPSTLGLSGQFATVDYKGHVIPGGV